MQIIDTLYRWYGKTPVRIVFIAIILLLIAAIVLFGSSEPITDETTESFPTVAVAPANSQSESATIELIGTVKAVSQAEIDSETSGRVTQVNVNLGDTVGAGAVIATLENASERAAVLQAEGAYEAAVAGAAQSDVSVTEAENGVQTAKDTALTTARNAFNTYQSIVRNDIDDVFTNPENQTPGLRLQGGGVAITLNNERVRIQSVLEEWQARSAALTLESDLISELAYTSTELTSLAGTLDLLITLVNDDDSIGVFTEAELATLSTTFSADRSTINTTLNAIENALTGLENANEALERAQIGGTSGAVSSANAQVKQALGALRAAEANLAKTIMRTPIAGTVNSLSVSTGDFVGSFEQIALVANNNALEITTFVGESDRSSIELGQSVLVEGTATGTVTNIAPAVDPVTRKIEIKIAAEDANIANGDTVTVRLTNGESTDTVTNTRLFIPITAVKFTETNGAVFTVEDNTLVAHPVEIGDIRGSFIEITSGLDHDTVIVIDARGRAPGQRVEAVSK